MFEDCWYAASCISLTSLNFVYHVFDHVCVLIFASQGVSHDACVTCKRVMNIAQVLVVVIVMIAIQPLLCDLLLELCSKTTFNKNIFASAL